jgi:predicted branched-subunit amino acid permease
MSDSETALEETILAEGGHFIWYLRGFREVVSLPALILASSFVGFAALAVEAGVTLPQAVFMTGIIWALPAKVVLVGAILAGNGLPAAAFAVALSSVRLTPMVVALVPELKARGTRSWVLYLLSHFVAVTSWVIAMHKVRTIPRTRRTAWYGGVGSSLVILNMGVVTAVYLVAQDLPTLASAALLLLTPMYFLTSLWGSARERATRIAMVFGLILGPVFAALVPEFSLLVTGLVGGTGAYLVHRLMARRMVS